MKLTTRQHRHPIPDGRTTPALARPGARVAAVCSRPASCFGPGQPKLSERLAEIADSLGDNLFRPSGVISGRWRRRTALGGKALTILASIPTANSAYSVFGQDPSSRWAVFPVVVDPARSPRFGYNCMVRSGLALVRTRGR
jgi:hypothetical protein